jgi:excisionase family DNA binding protein
MSGLADQLVRELSPDALRELAMMLQPYLVSTDSVPTETTLLTVAEAAARLRVSERTVRRAVTDGRLPHVRVGNRTRIAEDDLAAWATPPNKSTPRRRPRGPAATPQTEAATAAIAGTERGDRTG